MKEIDNDPFAKIDPYPNLQDFWQLKVDPFVEKGLYKGVKRIPSRIKDTSHMLNIIDNLNDSDLPENSILVSFDVVNMFPSIDNESGIKAVKKILNDREWKKPPTECILEASRLCLEWNNSVFKDKNFIQTDGTSQGPHMIAHVVTLL